MPPDGPHVSSHPVDPRITLRQACDDKDLRLAALNLSLLLPRLTDGKERGEAEELLPRLDKLETNLAATGLTDALLAQRDALLTSVAKAVDWTTSPTPVRSDAPLLRMKGVRRTFRNSTFNLHDVDIEVGAQELVGVVGMNGSGKSTVLRIAAGRQRQDAGEVSYPGITAKHPKSPVLARIAYVPQEPEPWSGRLNEHLSLLLAFHGVTGKANGARTGEVLREFDLVDLAERDWAQMSGGMRARCALALALGPRPCLIVMDEPMACLDPRYRRWFLDHLYRLAHRPEHPAGIVVSSHLVMELESVATRLFVLEEGRLVRADERRDGEGMVLDLVVDQPWRATVALHQSLGLHKGQVRPEPRPDPRQVRITFPAGTSRAAVLRALSEQGITPTRFSDLTQSVARRL